MKYSVTHDNSTDPVVVTEHEFEFLSEDEQTTRKLTIIEKRKEGSNDSDYVFNDMLELVQVETTFNLTEEEVFNSCMEVLHAVS